MKTRLLRRPATNPNETCESLLHRIIVANGLPHSERARNAVADMVFADQENGYVEMGKEQSHRTAHVLKCFESQRPKKRSIGAVCVKCLKEGLPQNILSAHPYASVCLLHGEKLNAHCPRCEMRSTKSWLYKGCCDGCQLSLNQFPMYVCSTVELENAAGLQAWLADEPSGASDIFMAGLWQVPKAARADLLELLIDRALGLPSTELNGSERDRMLAGRDWILRNIRNWRSRLLTSLWRYTKPGLVEAEFASYCRWLGECFTHLKVGSAEPLSLSPVAKYVVLALIGNDLFQQMDAISRELPISSQLRTERKPKRASRRRVCQYSIDWSGNNVQDSTCPQSLRIANAINARWGPRLGEYPQGRWRRDQIQYLVFVKGQKSIDLLQANIDGVVQPDPCKNVEYISLASLKMEVSLKRLAIIETGLIKRQIACYQIAQTGDYRQDTGIDREALGIWERNRVGGCHAFASLF